MSFKNAKISTRHIPARKLEQIIKRIPNGVGYTLTQDDSRKDERIATHVSITLHRVPSFALTRIASILDSSTRDYSLKLIK
jgi:hypothetical protein